VYDATHHVLGGLISSGALAPGPVWALAAAVLPLLVRHKSLVLDVTAVVAWALMVVLFTELAISVGHFAGAAATVHTAVVGAVAACVVGTAPCVLARRRTMRAGYTRVRVP
jgi:hypothetical protein